MSAHDFEFTAIDGAPLPLARFKGKPILLVNVASECGFTPQYKQLQELWTRYRDKGLIVLGVPSNDFGGQEPGSEAQIASFCASRYAVDFPLTAKQAVAGGGAHPLYGWIAAEAGEGGAPRWNFHKYLIGGDGTLRGAWPSKVSPTSPEVVEAVEAALAN